MKLNKPLTKESKIEAINLIIADLFEHDYICIAYDTIIGRNQLSDFPELSNFIRIITNMTDGSLAWHMSVIMRNLPSSELRLDAMIKGKIVLLNQLKADISKATEEHPLIMDKYTKEYIINLLN